MGFLDEVVITVVSGDGGKGCVSFRREKFIPKGGPDGGDGGAGGNIIIHASSSLNTLSDFSSKRHFKSQNGRPGKGKHQTGKNGSDIIIKVPLGTIIYDNETKDILADLVKDDEEILFLSGGIGGKGNAHFATSTNRTPRFAQDGMPGQKKTIRLSLKYIADIGLIGLPNVGKSTLLSRLTMARPKIDNYPFTTIFPNLGVMEFDNQKRLTIADIPGLIEGASEGKGLGHRFLKHVERTRFLLHLIDGAASPKKEILKDFYLLQDELNRYNPNITKKEQMVLINKTDLMAHGKKDIDRIRAAFTKIGFESLAISALTGEGLDELKDILAKKLLIEVEPQPGLGEPF
jgi:GTP-binding protein